jgi:hypothetical protein
VVSGRGPKGEVGARDRVTELLAGVAARVGSRIVTGQGVVRVGACDEGRSVFIKGGLALIRGPTQLREFFDFAGQLIEDWAFHQLAKKQTLLAAVVDAVLAPESG